MGRGLTPRTNTAGIHFGYRDRTSNEIINTPLAYRPFIQPIMNTLRLLAANLRLLSHRTLTQQFWAMPNLLCIQLRCYGRRRKQPDATRLTPPEGNQEKPKYVSYSNMSWPEAEKRLRVKFNKIERVPVEKMLGPRRSPRLAWTYPESATSRQGSGVSTPCGFSQV